MVMAEDGDNCDNVISVVIVAMTHQKYTQFFSDSYGKRGPLLTIMFSDDWFISIACVFVLLL